MLHNIKKMIIFLIVGVLLTTSSFLSYFLITPTNWYIVITLCILDFIYLFMNAYSLLSYYSDKRILKACVISIGYLLVFNVMPIVYLLIQGMISRILEIWKDILLYAFFTGPCLIFVLILIFLISFLYAYVNDRTRR